MLAAVGWHVMAFLAYFGQTTRLHAECLRGLVTGKLEYRSTVQQVAEIGVNSLPIAVVTMIFSGMVMGYHAAIQISKLGAGGLIGWLVAETTCRELAPVLVCIVVAARSGSAMAAELGTMKVTGQIDALRAMATNPVDYLVLPRYVACLVMVPLLVFIGDIVGVTGGYLMAVLNPNINHTVYFTGIPGNLETWTLLAGIIKSVAFGLIIALVGCHQGLTCRRAAEEVAHATMRSVVYAIMLIYGANLLLTAILFPPR